MSIILFAKWMFFTLVNAEFLASCFKLTPTLSRIRRTRAVILYQERTAIYHALTWEKKYWKLWQCLNSSANIDIHLLNNYYILKWNLGTSHTLYILSDPEFSGFGWITLLLRESSWLLDSMEHLSCGKLSCLL